MGNTYKEIISIQKKYFVFSRKISGAPHLVACDRTVLPRILSQLYALDHEIVLLDNCGIMQRISQKEILAYSFEIFKNSDCDDQRSNFETLLFAIEPSSSFRVQINLLLR